jgi:hypothetical protein
MRPTTSSLAFVVLALLALTVQNCEAFVKGSPTTRTRPVFASTELFAEAKKKAAKKAKAKSTVENFRKPEFVATLAEKLDTNKAGAELALAAVLGTIQEVSTCMPS